MSKQGKGWASRIVGSDTVPASSLLANELNFRIHPKNQQDALGGTLAEVGWVQQVIVNKRTSELWGADRNVDTLVDGHLRVSLALSQDDNTPVPVLYVDLTPNEERLILATLDPIAAAAVTDKEQLDALLRDVQSGDAAVQQFLSELAAKEGLIPPTDPYKEWEGMPEFEQGDESAAFKCIVNFASADDAAEFERLVGQQIPKNTHSIWFPKVERQNVRDLGYVSNES